MKSFAVPAGMTVEGVLKAMGQEPAAEIKPTPEPQPKRRPTAKPES